MNMLPGKVQIVVVDDEPFLLKLMRGMLNRMQFENVQCFESGEAALAELDAGTLDPHAILLDINMPGMDGVEFVRQLAARNYRGGLVLVSGEDESMLRATTMLARVRGLSIAGSLRKPPAPDQLEGLIEQCIDFSTRGGRNTRARSAQREYSAEEVRIGIEGGQLRNYYQPKVKVATGEVVGVETLVRWQHPDDGLLAPYLFVPVAEEHGLIDDLTRAVFREAVRQSNAWREAGMPLRVAVNLSMDNLAKVDSADFIISEVASLGAQSSNLVLEVTESRLMHDLAPVLDVLARLHLKRFRLSIDDFGTGHSSLVVLRDLLFDELKIDAGFVHNAWRNERLASFFKASLDLARHLGMEAVAEGVEDAQDWAFVRANACDMAQGYFIAKPMPPADLPAWMRSWRLRLNEELLLRDSH